MPPRSVHPVTAARLVSPSSGRFLVQATWATDSARVREQHVVRLVEGLGPDDETFLDSAMVDRATDVREASRALLVRLPASRLLERQRARLERHLLREGAGFVLDIDIDIDDSAVQDAPFPKDRRDPTVIHVSPGGQFTQQFFHLPPWVWEATARTTLDELLDGLDDEGRGLLLDCLAGFVTHHRYSLKIDDETLRWDELERACSVVVAARPAFGSGNLGVMDVAEAQAWFAARVLQSLNQISLLDGHPWGEALQTAVVEALAYAMPEKRPDVGWTGIDDLLREAGRKLDPAHANRLVMSTGFGDPASWLHPAYRRFHKAMTERALAGG